MTVTVQRVTNAVTLQSGSRGPQGEQGEIGLTGSPGGLPYQYDGGSTTMGDGGPGKVRFNNATLASATAAAFAAESNASGNPDISDVIADWNVGTSSVKGKMFVFKNGAQENFSVFNVASVTDNTAWLQISISHVASAGTISDEDNLDVVFVTVGDQGEQGDQGDRLRS